MIFFPSEANITALFLKKFNKQNNNNGKNKDFNKKRARIFVPFFHAW